MEMANQSYDDTFEQTLVSKGNSGKWRFSDMQYDILTHTVSRYRVDDHVNIYTYLGRTEVTQWDF